MTPDELLSTVLSHEISEIKPLIDKCESHSISKLELLYPSYKEYDSRSSSLLILNSDLPEVTIDSIRAKSLIIWNQSKTTTVKIKEIVAEETFLMEKIVSIPKLFNLIRKPELWNILITIIPVLVEFNLYRSQDTKIESDGIWIS